jgi:sugar/nucleoside kinase (ribokinase family)
MWKECKSTYYFHYYKKEFVMKKGICVAGNAIVDLLYPIESYPNEGELTTIQEDGIKKSTGGALCNVIVDLAKLDPELPLVAIGQIGKDENAQLIKETLNSLFAVILLIDFS